MQKFIKYFLAFGLILGLGLGIRNISAANININNGSFGTGNSNQNDIPSWEEKGNENDSSTLAKSPENSGEDAASPDGGRFARIGRDQGQDGFICQQITTTGYQNLVLSYYWRGDNEAEDNSDLGIVEFIKNGSCESANNQWTTITSHELDDGNANVTSWSNLQSLNLPASLNNTTFFLRFRGDVSADNEYFRVDGITLSGNQIVSRTLNITKSGDGHVTADSSEINCGEDCVGTFTDGSVVILTPVAASGWYFTGFSGDCSGTEPCSLTMNGDKSVQATFEKIKTNLVVTKVVCTNEADLPNWGNGGPSITSTTAIDWVNSHPGCYLASDFNFEWAPFSEPNPGDNVSTGGANWTSFGPTINTGVTSTEVVGQEPFWVREKVTPYYLEFSGALQGQNDMESESAKYSAELYCQNDVLNYDNYDYVEMPTKSDTVHCVAFNFEIDACPNIEGEQLGVPMGMHKVNGSCVPQTSTVSVCKQDESQNNLAGWTVMLKGKSFQSGLSVPTNISSGVNTNNLTAGLSYIFKSFGTWLNQGGANPVDTEYSTTDNWLTQMDGYTGYQTDILELQINNSFDPNSSWGVYNSSHKYARSMIAPINGPANLRIFDGTGTTQNEGWFGDNIGSLTVDIDEGYAGTTGENGCTIFENVPYGSYTVDEIMQDGWENVSGLSEVVVNENTETFYIVNKKINNYAPGRVRVSKFIDGVKATSLMTASIHFPIYSVTEALWFNLDNDGHREGDVPYQASTLELAGGSVYELREELTTAYVGSTCNELKPFSSDEYKPYALVGYSIGKTYEEAVSAPITPTLDPITVDGDVHVIVHNTKCQQEEEPENPPQICTQKTMTINSDGNETVDTGSTTILSFIHSGWSTISGANWIWNNQGVVDPLIDAEATFTKNFNIPGNPISGVLNILTDNSYSGNVNDFTGIVDASENNFANIDSYNIPQENLINGSNTLSFKIKNWALVDGTPETNPAGLAYSLTISYEECLPIPEDDDEEVPVNTAPVIVLNGDATINLFVGDNYSEMGAVANDAEDGNNLPVTNISGTVDANTAGSYILTYNYIDSQSLAATPVYRTVNVSPVVKPEPEPEPEPEDEEEEENNNNNNNGGGGGIVPQIFFSNVNNNPAPVPTGRVLGESTTCGIYLDKFLRKGYKNDPEAVKKIQEFLNNYLKSNLPITGFFGPLTDIEVKKFQWMHRDEILTPWNLKSPTGIVYLTTTKKINQIMCPELNLGNVELIPFEDNPNSPKL